jgi:hypothetical protein
MPALRRLRTFLENGQAVVSGDGLAIQNKIASELVLCEAAALGMPPLARLMADIRFKGRLDSAQAQISVLWKDSTHRSVIAQRYGLLLRWGELSGRLSAELYRLIAAIDEFNEASANPSADSVDSRIGPWAVIQDEIRKLGGEGTRQITLDGYTESLTIYQAGSFALDVNVGERGLDFTPVLMSRSCATSLEDDAPAAEIDAFGELSEESPAALLDAHSAALLTPDLQRRFAEQRFARQENTPPAYVLAQNTYLLIDPDLRKALDIVRSKGRASEIEKREFIKNPRTAICEALGLEGGHPLAAALFVETRQYSERVIGLGVWQKAVLPFLTKVSESWLPETFTVVLRGKPTTVTKREVEQLASDLDAAVSNQMQSITFRGEPIEVNEATAIVEEALSSKPESEIDRPNYTPADDSRAGQASSEPQTREQLVLLAQTNFEAVDFKLARRPRKAFISANIPVEQLGNVVPKPHQLDGFSWLVEGWISGSPGLLLADDMGLGKTLQTLLFLAWLREHQIAAGHRNGSFSSRGPILIVAPTALLQNWADEAERFLADDALGERIDAFGSGLRRISSGGPKSSSPEDRLDIDQLRDTGWILTTYETLADNHRSFAKVPFSVAVFDEIQKIKDPSTLNSHAARTVNADFVVGLTGTPIENRIEDLWSIMDRVAPGYLGDLKSFSRNYSEASGEQLKNLKWQLDERQVAAPPIMLRRMKADILEGLPAKREKLYSVEMSEEQAAAYLRVIEAAKSKREGKLSKGAMLSAIHAMRGVSLFPSEPVEPELGDHNAIKSWAKRSARVSKTLEILSEIARMGEKALVFVEDLRMQATFAAVVAAIFNLPRLPSIINGGVEGRKRQFTVNGFQQSKLPFDVLVLSPRAAGMGLNITAANHVIHLSRWWNPAVEDQCNDRCYRIG